MSSAKKFKVNGVVYDIDVNATETIAAAQAAAEAANAAAANANALQQNLESGSVVPAKAGNLDSWAGKTLNAPDVQTEKVFTTGGDVSIDSSVNAQIEHIIAKTDFTATSLLSTGFNLLRNAVAVGDGWYFPVPALAFGAINTAAKPNGVLFTNSEGSNLTPTVRFKKLSDGAPSSVSDGSACAYTDATTGGKTYRFYTTSEAGYIIVSGITRASVCAHIGWSGRYDEYKAINASGDAGATVALAAAITAMHSFGKMLAIGNIGDRIDRIGATQVRLTAYIDRVQPSWLTTLNEDGTTYTHEASITAMKTDGAAAFMEANHVLTVNGNTVSYSDNSSAASTDYVKYEKAAPVATTYSLATDFAVEDWGCIVLQGASGEAEIAIAYAQGMPDSLRAIAAVRMGAAEKAIEDADVRTDNLESEVLLLAGDDFEHKYGQPRELYAHDTPAESRIPDNWVQLEDGGYNWTGKPSALGQVYNNVDNLTGAGSIWKAYKKSNYELDWMPAN